MQQLAAAVAGNPGLVEIGSLLWLFGARQFVCCVEQLNDRRLLHEGKSHRIAARMRAVAPLQ